MDRVILVETLASGEANTYTNTLEQAVQSQKGAMYSAVIEQSGETPRDLLLKKQGDNLLVLVEDEVVGVVEDFYQNDMAASFSVAGNSVANSAAVESAVDSVVWSSSSQTIGVSLGGWAGLGAAVWGGSVALSDKDKSAPAPDAPSLVLAEDSGVSDSDGVTKNSSVQVFGLEEGANWEYSTDGGQNWQSGTGDSFTVPEGDYLAGDLQVRQTNQSNKTSEIGQLGAITIDTTEPTLSLSLAEDTGESDSDGITSNTTINVSGLESGQVWQYKTSTDGDWIDGSSSGSFELNEGDYASGAVQVRAVDAAGNTGNAVSLGAITIDTTAPTLSLSLDEDTGESDSDGITSNTTINVSGLESGQVWQYKTSVDGDWIDGSSSGSFELDEGDYDSGAVQVRAVDAAGNEGTPASLGAVTVDITAPNTRLDLRLAEDTGDSDTDGITSNTTINVSGLESGQAWQYKTSTDGDWVDGSGDSFELDEGDYASGAVQVRAVDAAGNPGSTAQLSAGVTIDTTGPKLVDSFFFGDGFEIYFSEPVLLGSGNVFIDGSSYDIESTELHVYENRLTLFDINQRLREDSVITLENGAVTDALGNDYVNDIVIFDLLNGVSSDHSSRTFDDSVAYTIYIRVNSSSEAIHEEPQGDAPEGATWGKWSSGDNLGDDDRIILVGSNDRMGIVGRDGAVVTDVSVTSSYSRIEWFDSSGWRVASLSLDGSFARSYNDESRNLYLWSGTRASLNSNTNAISWLNVMPVGILTSQGLI